MNRYYFDVHLPEAIAIQLRRRGVDVLRAQEDAADRTPDDLLLERTALLGRVLVTQDNDFEALAYGRVAANMAFAGVIFAAQDGGALDRYVEDLELIAKGVPPEELANTYRRLPI